MSVIDDFDPFPRQKPQDITNTSQDPLMSLSQPALDANVRPATPNDVQAEIESRAAERKARVLSDIAAHPWSHSSSTSHPSHAPRSPPRRLSSIMVPSTSASVHEPALVSVSPNESSLYHADPKSPPFTVRKRLSTSLFTDDQHFTSHPRTSSPEPQQPQPHHAATMGPSTLGNRVRPALVGLFSSHSGHHSEGSSSSSLTLSGQHRSNTDPSPQRHRSPAPPAPITLTGPPGYTFILNSDLAEAIRPNLPSRLRIASKWTLLYSLDAHGVSLATLYARTEAGMAGRGMSAGVLLVVKDNDGYVFGAFINEKLRKTEGFYGSGECFLWKETPFPKGDVRMGTGVKVFNWTGRNNYVVQSDDDFISVGGGRDGKFGLWIDASFEKGYSTRCLTFDNQVLSGPDLPRPDRATPDQNPGKRFVVNRVEVWRIGQ